MISSEKPTRKLFSAFKRLAQVLLFLVGLALFIWVIRAAGPEKLRELLPVMSLSSFWALFLIYGFMNFWDAAAWQVLCPSEWTSRRRSAWKDFYLIRVAGEAVNGMTPFVDIGGEFLKIALTADVFQIPKKISSVTVILARTTYFFSEIVFWMTGLLPALFLSRPAVSNLWGVGITTLICLGLAALILIWQKRGFFRTLSDGLKIFGFSSELTHKFHLSLKETDDAIATFYREKKRSLSISLIYHWIGWTVGGVETYFMFQVIGAPIDLWQAMAAEALLQIVKTGSFFIPGNLGAQEAGVAWFAQSAGLHPSYGVMVSLLKRARQLIWTAIGLAIWGGYTIILSSKRKADL